MSEGGSWKNKGLLEVVKLRTICVEILRSVVRGSLGVFLSEKVSEVVPDVSGPTTLPGSWRLTVGTVSRRETLMRVL